MKLLENLLGFLMAVFHHQPARRLGDPIQTGKEHQGPSTLKGQRWTPCLAASIPEIKAKANPALNCITKQEADSVDVDETASKVYRYDFVHPDLIDVRILHAETQDRTISSRVRRQES